MTHSNAPFRSVLYIPGSHVRALEKARGLAADALIFDLEDAVAPSEKENARRLLAQALADGGYAPRQRIVRINDLASPWGEGDVDAVANMSCDAVLLPKVNGVSEIDKLARKLSDVPLWAMIETAQGVLNAAEIAAHPAVHGFVMGTNDLAKELRCGSGADRAAMTTALQHTLLAARAHGVVAVDGVYNAFKDTDGLAAECAQGREWGFDGKTLIHPAQLDTANQWFSPSKDELLLAQRQIDAHEAAERAGSGVAVLDGKIVENLHVETARRLIQQSKSIAMLEE